VAHDLRSVLDAELDAQAEPDAEDLAVLALRRGRRMRRRRRAVKLAGATGAAAVILGVFVLAPGHGRPSTALTAVPAARPSSTASSSLAPSGSPAALADATPAGLLQEVVDLLPKVGITDPVDGAVMSDGSLFVQATVNAAKGPWMFRVWVVMGAAQDPNPKLGETGRTLPDGTRLVFGGLPSNCAEHRYVVAYRTDGSVASVRIANCLAWDGTGNAPAVPQMTDSQAIALVTDPALGVTLNRAVVEAGNVRYGHAPMFS